MGLLEKALQYKNEMNRNGRETLIDRIQGPAETEFVASGEEIPARTASPRITSIEPGDDEITFLDEDLLHELDGGDEPENRPVDPIILDDDDLIPADVELNDDAFSLPEDDDASPDEVLRRQKTDVRGIDRESLSINDIPAEGEGGEPEMGGYRLSADDPFGKEDEPIIPKIKKESQTAPERDHVSEKHELEEEQEGMFAEDGDRADEKAGEEFEDSLPLPQSDNHDRYPRKNKRFQDFLVLYEIGKEILRSENRKDLYDVVLFSIMGQIGASSSSIMVEDGGSKGRWLIGDSRGVTIRNKKLAFETSEGIMSQVVKRKTVVDLDEFKDNSRYSDEYYKFVSIDARLVSPLSYGGVIIGAIVLGEKLTIGDYSEEEKDFITAVSEISAIALHKVNAIEKLQEENLRFKRDLEYVNQVDEIKARIVSDVNLKRMEEIIASDFHEMGITGYAAFIDEEKNDRYVPVFTDKNDDLGLKADRFSLSYSSSLIDYISELRENVKLDDHRRLKVISDAFPETALKKMTVFWIYPFKFGAKLAGFLLVTNIDEEERENEIHSKLTRLTQVIFSYTMNLKMLDIGENRYIDYIEGVLRRMERELENAKNLHIPLTVILFSIKNFKRYYALYGRAESRKIIDILEEIIRSRLSDPDFSVRFDRNKLLIVLPGKNKKYAVPLANTIRNEIIQHFKKKEMQLLVTFLTSEYPEDGEDLHTLLDVID